MRTGSQRCMVGLMETTVGGHAEAELLSRLYSCRSEKKMRSVLAAAYTHKAYLKVVVGDKDHIWILHC